jgi:L-gulonate 3-dehydrogenase
MDHPIHTVAVVGGGLVGLGWAIVFARAGVAVRAFDAEETIHRSPPDRLRASLAEWWSTELSITPHSSRIGSA